MNENKFKDPGSGLGTLTGGLDRYKDYDVIDDANHKVGSLNGWWVDRGGHPLFLGIKTGPFLGRTHVVPCDEATLSGRNIRLPYSEDTIKNAPMYDIGKNLEVSDENEVYKYFHMDEPRGETEMKSGTEMEKERFTGTPPPLSKPEALGTAGVAGITGTTPLKTPQKPPQPAPITEQRIQQPETAPAEQGKMFLSEEALKVGKRVVDAGGVRLRKVIRTETVSLPVELSHEEFVIERVPAAQGTLPAAAEAFADKEIFVSLHREEPIVSKESRVREEVRCRKQPHIERRTISDSVRKEDVEVVNVKEPAPKPNP